MGNVKVIGCHVFLLCLALLSCQALGGAGPGDETIFNVLDFGAKPGGKESSSYQIESAWRAMCRFNGGKRKLVIPKGEFLAGPLNFLGICNGTTPLVFEVVGTLKASTTDDYFDSRWMHFIQVNGLVITGGGTLNGQGESLWSLSPCEIGSNCVPSQVTITLDTVTNAIIRNITSVNSRGFHFQFIGCNNVTAKRLHIIAPKDSPLTNGIDVFNSTNVQITKSVISTGDDCVSIDEGSTDVFINRIDCASRHGISVGTLGYFTTIKHTRGILVKNCTLSNTDNGLRIKTWSDSPPSEASNIIFQDIVMNSVKNPIVIDQHYCNEVKCTGKPPSLVKISDIHYRNITGTTTSEVAVNLMCSDRVPCQKVQFSNINLKYVGPSTKKVAAPWACKNANITYSGLQNQTPCL